MKKYFIPISVIAIIALFFGTANSATMDLQQLTTMIAPNLYSMELDVTNVNDGTGDWLVGMNLSGFGETKSELESSLSNFSLPTGWTVGVFDGELNFGATPGYQFTPNDSSSFDFLMDKNYQNLVALGYTGDGESYNPISVNVSNVPEPATMLLFGTGLLGLAGVARRKKQA